MPVINMCETCQHPQYLHNRWYVCDVLGCKPCHDEKVCERCSHTMMEHTSTTRIICCRRADCKFVACFSEQMEHHGGKPFRGRVKIENGFVVAEESDYRPTTPRRVVETREEPKTYVVERRYA